jgi:predicted nucleic acid-binding protein
MAVLVDTGILLRSFVRSEPSCAAIRRSIRELRERGEELVTAVQNIAEFSNVSTRPTSARGGYGLPVSKLGLRIGYIERLCRRLYESEESYAIWRRLITAHGVSGIAVHDARLVSIMLANDVNRVLTLNDRDFRRFEPDGITILSP